MSTPKKPRAEGLGAQVVKAHRDYMGQHPLIAITMEVWETMTASQQQAYQQQCDTERRGREAAAIGQVATQYKLQPDQVRQIVEQPNSINAIDGRRQLTIQFAAMTTFDDPHARRAGQEGIIRIATSSVAGEIQSINAEKLSKDQSDRRKGKTKLTESQKKQVIREYEAAFSKYGQLKHLAGKFDVSKDTISRLVNPATKK